MAGWQVERNATGVRLSRPGRGRLDVQAATRLPDLRPVALAHEVRKDLWRALSGLRGFSPVVDIRRDVRGLELRAGGQIDGAAGQGLRSRRDIEERIAGVLNDATRPRALDRAYEVEMIKHRGFPSRMPGTDYQFTIRRANPKGVTPLVRRERFRDRKPADKRADEAFLLALWEHFADQPFERGNLDAGRLSWLFGREVVAVDDPFDPEDYEALLRIDTDATLAGFPHLFE